MAVGPDQHSGEGRRLAAELARRGPHEVLRGDLGLVGLPGSVFTPGAGVGLPAVAFGHGWLQPVFRYDELLRHLASWGLVVAAPDTQRGPLGSHRQFAADLRTALDVCTGVRLGRGDISVEPGKLGLAGHSVGGGCAVLAAAADQRCRAVATVSPAETLPSAVDAARACTMPALHVACGKDNVAPPTGHAEPLARAWAGPVQLRRLPRASHLGVTDRPHWSDLLIDGKPESGTRRLAKVLLTAFLLRHLDDQRRFDALLDVDLPGAARQRIQPASA